MRKSLMLALALMVAPTVMAAHAQQTPENSGSSHGWMAIPGHDNEGSDMWLINRDTGVVYHCITVVGKINSADCEAAVFPTEKAQEPPHQ